MTTRKPKLNAQILEEATAWFIDFNEEQVDPAGQEEFNAWLRRSPEHVRAFLQVSAFWEDAEALGKRPNLDLAGVIARAQAENNVFSLDTHHGAATTPPRKRRAISRIPIALAATLLLAIGTGLIGWYIFYSAPTYVTGIGEQRSIRLDDGSSVELNSRSRIRLRFTRTERLVELLEGQALFEVQKDPSRPFVVTAGDTSVRAVGTQFDVYRKLSGTVVTVVEGRVAVAPSPEIERSEEPAPPAPGLKLSPGELLLAAGEQIVITATAVAAPRPANIAVAMAWTENKLVFESTPLREVVEEFNRYNRQQLVIHDPQLYDFHVSGVFPSTDSNRMLQLLRQRFGVVVSRSGDEIQISKGKNP